MIKRLVYVTFIIWLSMFLLLIFSSTSYAKERMEISYGEFKITAYCACSKCCGHCTGITASGAKVKQGVTVAVDPEYIPLGTHLIINGVEYIAQDTGVKGRTIDIFFDSHDVALKYGVKELEVFIIE